MRALVLLGLTSAALLAPASVHAQLRRAPRPDLSDPPTRACVAALPASDLTPTLVSLAAGGEFARDSGAMQALFLLTQDVGTRMREQLGAASGVVPVVDSTLPWSVVWGKLNGQLHLDGMVTIEPHEVLYASDSLAVAGDSLIARALKSLIAEDERWPFEPLDFVLSMPFTLYFAAPEVTADNTRIKTWRTVAIPVFSRALPYYAPVRWAREHSRQPDLSRWMRQGMFSDSTTLRFRYDAEGNVDVRSAREVPYRADIPGMGLSTPVQVRSEPRSARRRAASHDEFVFAMSKSLADVQWSVGRIGSCALPRVALQSFWVRFGVTP